MTKRSWFLTVLVLLISCVFFLSSAQSEPPNFPDRKSFYGVSGVTVEILSYENMEEVTLTPTDLRTRVEAKLHKAGIRVSNFNRLTANKSKSGGPTDIKPDVIAILGIQMRRTEDSALFGGKIGSVGVTLQLFQQVTIAHNQHPAQAITWSNSRNIFGGSKRPQNILKALDELVDLFAKDFGGAHSQNR